MSGDSNARRGAIIAAWIVSVIFIYAAASKIRDPAEFAQSIKYYKILPLWAINGWALFLPWLEIVAGVALLLPAWRRAGAAITLGLSLIFAAAVSSALIRGLDITCGCFGTGSSKAGWKTLTLDAFLIFSSVFIVCFGQKNSSEPRPRVS